MTRTGGYFNPLITKRVRSRVTPVDMTASSRKRRLPSTKMQILKLREAHVFKWAALYLAPLLGSTDQLLDKRSYGCEVWSTLALLAPPGLGLVVNGEEWELHEDLAASRKQLKVVCTSSPGSSPPSRSG